jgi:carbon monoxide dehydrogenase subunit G
VAEAGGQATCIAPPERAWEFVRDFENWIREFDGYDAHTVEPEETIVLQLRGKVGFMTKVTRFRIAITDEDPPRRLAFSMKGLTDPLEGGGELSIAAVPDGSSIVSYRLTVAGRGMSAPILDAFLADVLPKAVGDLAAGIAERLADGTPGQ